MTKPHYQLYINGEWCEGSSNQRLDTINPATGDAWATFACADADDVERAVQGARAALNNPEWAKMSPTNRGKLLYRLAELVEQNAERLQKSASSNHTSMSG